MRFGRNSIIALVVTILVSTAAAPAVAEDSARLMAFKTQVAKEKGGPYKDFIQNTKVAEGTTRFLYWRVQNFNAAPLELKFDDAFTQDPNPEGARITWFKGRKGTKKITVDVKGAGYDFTLPGDKTVYFRAGVHSFDGSSFCLAARSGTESLGYSTAAFGINGPCL